MALSTPFIFFENTAGQVLSHPNGYAILRYLPNQRQPGELARLLTALGQLLLRGGWHRFLADNRQMPPLNEEEKAWFASQWLGHKVPRPAPLYGAVVLPTEVMARLSISQMLSAADTTTMVYRSFTEQSQAETYLAGLPWR
ncbi:hypothetical protein HHL22_09315 [Hymenobacter sp. RP-2-7]|uniref:Uncharacterized protein n=1 Tax=Hymenobacter polaris TaxID=2682546 RepID=A0A7Y0FME0_9BACT|nr:hypothetical protein [Hymenobacter polaris]NML65401.1 hypothetical protein [Hymenobacter polaris]